MAEDRANKKCEDLRAKLAVTMADNRKAWTAAGELRAKISKAEAELDALKARTRAVEVTDAMVDAAIVAYSKGIETRYRERLRAALAAALKSQGGH
jgi:hypothetical protein